MEKKRIITIGREFGSGGRTIGKEVADRLGIPCYDHELIDRLAEESGLSKEYITNESEYASHSSWTAAAFSSVRSFGVPSNQDYLWAIQRRIILELGQKENCVIVGRCADAILEGSADLLKVFVHADFEKRAKRIVEKYGETEEPTEKRLRDKDKRRALYYQFYTDLEWGNMSGCDRLALLIEDTRIHTSEAVPHGTASFFVYPKPRVRRVVFGYRYTKRAAAYALYAAALFIRLFPPEAGEDSSGRSAFPGRREARASRRRTGTQRRTSEGRWRRPR